MTGDFAAIRSIMAHLFKPLNRSRFQKDRHPQDVSYPRKSDELGKGFFQKGFASDRCFNPLNLTGEKVNVIFQVNSPT
jgi:hypothetical protein